MLQFYVKRHIISKHCDYFTSSRQTANEKLTSLELDFLAVKTVLKCSKRRSEVNQTLSINLLVPEAHCQQPR